MDQVASLLNRPKAYCNIDGVGELGVGFMCLCFALLQWLQIHSPESSLWNQVYTLLIFVALMCAVIHFGTKAIKRHITYPRTGFVEYRKKDTVWIPLAIAAAVSAPLSAGVFLAIRHHWDIAAPASFAGLFFSASYAYGFARTVRWKWTVALAIACGSLTIAMLPADVIGGVARDSWVIHLFPARVVGAFLLNIAFYGVLLALSGGISFYLYLRRTRPSAEGLA